MLNCNLLLLLWPKITDKEQNQPTHSATCKDVHIGQFGEHSGSLQLKWNWQSWHCSPGDMGLAIWRHGFAQLNLAQWFFWVKNRQKVTLKKIGVHFVAKFLLFKERFSSCRGQIGFSYALPWHLWLLATNFEVFSIDMSQVMPNLLCNAFHFGCITKYTAMCLVVILMLNNPNPFSHLKKIILHAKYTYRPVYF